MAGVAASVIVGVQGWRKVQRDRRRCLGCPRRQGVCWGRAGSRARKGSVELTECPPTTHPATPFFLSFPKCPVPPLHPLAEIENATDTRTRLRLVDESEAVLPRGRPRARTGRGTGMTQGGTRTAAAEGGIERRTSVIGVRGRRGTGRDRGTGKTGRTRRTRRIRSKPPSRLLFASRASQSEREVLGLVSAGACLQSEQGWGGRKGLARRRSGRRQAHLPRRSLPTLWSLLQLPLALIGLRRHR